MGWCECCKGCAVGANVVCWSTIKDPAKAGVRVQASEVSQDGQVQSVIVTAVIIRGVHHSLIGLFLGLQLWLFFPPPFSHLILLLFIPFHLFILLPFPMHSATLRVAVLSAMAQDLAVYAIGLDGNGSAAVPTLGFVRLGCLECRGGSRLAVVYTMLILDALLNFSWCVVVW